MEKGNDWSDQLGMSTSLESPEQYRCDLTVHVTKSVRLSLEVIVEFDPQDTTEARQVWTAVTPALVELLRLSQAPAMLTALRSTPS